MKGDSDRSMLLSLGAPTDTPVDIDEGATARTATSLLKGIKNYLRTLKGTVDVDKVRVTVVDGAGLASIGATTDAPFDGVEDGTARTIVSLLKGAKNYIKTFKDDLALIKAHFIPSTVSAISDLSAENTFTDELAIAIYRKVCIKITGTFVGTLQVQTRTGGAGTWGYVGGGITGIGEWEYEPKSSDCRIKVGFPTGGYTSGAAHVEVRQG